MKGNFSRLPRRGQRSAFSSVLLQQGRVLLDADWNDLVEIVEAELRARTRMIIGEAGGPEDGEGFGLGLACGVDLNSGGPRDGQYDQSVSLRRRPSLPFREASADAPYTLRLDFIVPAAGCAGELPRAVLLGVPGRFTVHVEADLCLALHGPDDRLLARLGRVEPDRRQSLCLAFDGRERLLVWIFTPPDAAAPSVPRCDEIECPAWADPNPSPTRSAVTIGASHRGDGSLRCTLAGLWIWDAHMEPASLPRSPRHALSGCQLVCALDLSAVEPRHGMPDAAIRDASGKGNHGWIRVRHEDQSLPPVRLLGAEIGAGRYVVAGLDADNPEPVPFERQPWSRGELPASRTLGEVAYLFYLQVWERFASALQYPHIVEPALGGPDTTARTQTVWQVGLLVGRDAAEVERRWNTLSSWRGDRGLARFFRPAGEVGHAGNRLYRAEIHHPGWALADSVRRDASSLVFVERVSSAAILVEDPDIAGLLQVGSRVALGPANGLSAPFLTFVTCVAGDRRFELASLPDLVPVEWRLQPIATFKWSRANGAVAFPVRDVVKGDGNDTDDADAGAASSSWTFTLENAGYNGFNVAKDDYLELIDDAQDLARRGGTFFRITEIDEQRLTIRTYSTRPLDAVHLGHRPVLRRWEHRADQTTGLSQPLALVTGTPLLLEHGIQIEFAGHGLYAGADWWVVPVRDEVGDGLLWPGDRHLPPQGIALHEAKLASLHLGLGHAKAHDLRERFAPLTELTKQRRSPEAAPPDAAALAERILHEVWAGRARVLVEAGAELPGMERTGVRVEGRSLTAETWQPADTADAPRGAGVALIWQHRPVFLGDAASRLDERGAWQPLPAIARRIDFAACACGSRLWVLGGSDPGSRDGAAISRVEVLEEPGGAWRTLDGVTLEQPAFGLAAVTFEGHIHVVGGVTDGEARKTHRVLDPRTLTFTQAADMRVARKNFALVVHEGLLYAIGGCDSNDACLASVECYDPASDTWRFVFPAEGSLQLGPTADLAAASVPEGIVVTGGFDGAAKGDTWLLRPALRRWQALAPLSTARSRHGLVMTADWKDPDRPALHAIGGVDERRSVAQIESLPLTRSFDVLRPGRR